MSIGIKFGSNLLSRILLVTLLTTAITPLWAMEKENPKNIKKEKNLTKEKKEINIDDSLKEMNEFGGGVESSIIFIMKSIDELKFYKEVFKKNEKMKELLGGKTIEIIEKNLKNNLELIKFNIVEIIKINMKILNLSRNNKNNIEKLKFSNKELVENLTSILIQEVKEGVQGQYLKQAYVFPKLGSCFWDMESWKHVDEIAKLLDFLIEGLSVKRQSVADEVSQYKAHSSCPKFETEESEQSDIGDKMDIGEKKGRIEKLEKTFSGEKEIIIEENNDSIDQKKEIEVSE